MSTHDDATGKRVLEPAALDRLWDAMNRQIVPVGGRTGGASIESAETIRLLGDHDDAPHASAGQVDAIWMTIAAETLPGMVTAQPGAPARGRANLWWRLLALLQTIVRQATIGALAGFLVGMVVVGGGARIFMRVAALLSSARLDGAMTENGNQVGVITFGGTIGLLLFGGMLPGVLGGIVVMALRPWLPAAGWRRYLLAGAVGFAVAGPLVLEGGDNPDYKRFGILGINVCLFTLLPFFFGITVVPVIDALDRRFPRGLPSFRQGAVLALASLPMFLFVIPLLPIAMSALQLEPAGLLLLLPVIRVLAPFWAKHAPTIDERRRRELRGARIGYAAMAVPCLLGLVFMAQSLARLL